MSTVRSVRQAFAILRLLAGQGPLTLSEIARALELGPSSCLNLLRTLVDEAAVERETGTKRYTLAADWNATGLFQDDPSKTMLERLHPTMARLAREQSATIGLWMVAPGRRLLLVGHVESDAAMRIQLADGQRQPLGSGAVGRALAAAQRVDDVELARRHAEVRWATPFPLARYIEEIRSASKQGFAIDDGKGFAGVCSVAAAIPSPQPRFLISASVFAGSRENVEIAALGHALTQIPSP